MGDGVILAVVGILSALITVVGVGIISLLKSQDAKNTKQQEVLEAIRAEERTAAAKREERLTQIIESHNESLNRVAESQNAVASTMKDMGAAIEHKTEVLQQQVLATGVLSDKIDKIDRIKEKEQ